MRHLRNKTLRNCVETEVDSEVEKRVCYEAMSLSFKPLFDALIGVEVLINRRLYSAAYTLEGVDSEEVLKSVIELIY